MTSDDQLIDELAQAVLDGDAIDWAATESDGDATGRLIRQLKVVAAVAEAHRQDSVFKGHPARRDTTPPLESGVHVRIAERGRGAFADVSSADEPGKSLVGRQVGSYKILALAGRGGMGDVYRAHDTRLGRDVAIKVVPDAFLSIPGRLARFEREAQVLATLSHPHIGAIYELEEADGVRGLVLEFVEGPTLAERLTVGPLSVRESVDVARQIADALQAAHEKGIVHRDLKPPNIKITPDGSVKVLDFGLAKVFAREELDGDPLQNPPVVSENTGDGVIRGTPAYMSPEQAQGKPIDKRTDVWAFGCVLYEMLTAKRAFNGENASDTLTAVLKGEPAWEELPSDVPSALRTLIRRCLEKDRRRRIGDVSSALTLIDDQSVVVSTRPHTAGLPILTIRWTAALVLVGALAGYVGWRFRADSESVSPATFEVPFPVQQGTSVLGRHLVDVSPAGSHVVYTGNNQLYLQPLDQLEAVPIRVERVAHGPFFSYDGEWIGFWDAGLLRKVAVSGGAPIPIARVENPFGATWNADNTIVFALAGGVWTVDGDGGTPTQLIKLEAGEMAQSPQMLPGRRVLFTLARNNDWRTARVVVQSLGNGTRTELVQGSDGRYISSGHLLYGRGDTVFAVRFDSSTLEVSQDSVELLRGVGRALPGLSAAVQVSRTGKTLVYVPASAIFSSLSSARTMVWVDRQGRETPIHAPPRAYVMPRLSPDEKRIAVDVLDQEHDIWVCELPCTSLRRLTLGSEFERYPVWEDGRSVIYSSGRVGAPNSPTALFVRAADGSGDPRELARYDESVYPLSVTPDGSVILRQKKPWVTVDDLLKLSLSGGPSKPLFNPTGFSIMNAEVSPDGSLVAYQSDESGRPEIWVRPYPNTNAFRTQVTYARGTRPLWAHNGRELFYESGGRLMSIPVTKGPTFGDPRTIFDRKYFMASVVAGRTYDISLDDKRFLMLKAAPDPAEPQVSAPGPSPCRTGPCLVVVQNWFEQLRKRVSSK